jgi:GTPase KRas protein
MTIDSYRKECVIDDEVAVLDIFDMSGQEEYSAMHEQYMCSGQGFLLLYSLKSRSSLEILSTFQNRSLDRYSYPMVIVAIDAADEPEPQIQPVVLQSSTRPVVHY